MEELYYLCSQNKGDDQLRSYCKADLRLLFSHMQYISFLKMLLTFCTSDSNFVNRLINA